MFNPYPFYGYPPPQYPPQMGVPPTHSDLERGMKIALKIREKETRKEEKKKLLESKKKAEDKKAIDSAQLRTLSSIEWFIVGVISYPFVGPLYNYALHHAQNMVK